MFAEFLNFMRRKSSLEGSFYSVLNKIRFYVQNLQKSTYSSSKVLEFAPLDFKKTYVMTC